MQSKTIHLNGGLNMIEIDGKLINLRNVLFACSEDKGVTRIVFVNGKDINVHIDYKVVKMAMLKRYNSY